MEQVAFVPARKRVIAALLALVFIVVVVFTLLLRHTMRSAVPLRTAAFDVRVPAGFAYACSFTNDGEALRANGWACIAGEGIRTVDNWVVLYDAEQNTYWRLPTAMVIDEAATASIADGGEYGRAGFTALVALGGLEKGPAAYELCFAYRSNGHNLLVHTGQTVGGGAE